MVGRANRVPDGYGIAALLGRWVRQIFTRWIENTRDLYGSNIEGRWGACDDTCNGPN